MISRRPAVHRTIVVVDVEAFGARQRTDSHRLAVRAALYQMVQQAFDEAGLSWVDCDHEDRGDAVFILAPAEMPKAPFVDVVPHALVMALGEHNRTHPAEERIRLRMALHAGEVAYDEHGVTAAAVNLTFRLQDAHPFKTALAESPGVLALITSGWFFDEVVRNSRVTNPARFRPVLVTVKETSTVGWISLPDYSYPPDAAHLTTPPSMPTGGPVPRQLPAPPRLFTGRAAELDNLTSALDDETGPGRTMVISAIGGAGGIGKTWLALQWAHRNLHRFPGGQLFVDLRGFSPVGEPMTSAVAVRGFLDALGIEAAHIPADPHAQTALFRSLVADRRMLVVLDNAIDTEQVAQLLPGSSTCTVVVTSRNRLSGLTTRHGAHHVPVDVLTSTEARALLSARLGTERVVAEAEAVDELIKFCHGFPLALSIIASRVDLHPRLSLATVAAELHEVGVQALDDDDPVSSLPTVFSWSYQALTAEQATVFALVGLAPGPDIGLPAAASLTGLTVIRARAALHTLEHTSLLDRDDAGRHRMHDLVRRYAADTANRDIPGTERDAALRRVVGFYLHTAHAADQVLDPHRESVKLDPPPPDSRPQSPRDEAEALAWLDAEHACLLATQRLAADRGWHMPAWQLAPTLHTFHWRRGRLPDQAAVARAGLTAARHLGNPATEAAAHRLLAEACALTDEHAEALNHLQQALTLAEDTDDLTSQAHTHRVLAWAWGQQERLRRALEHVTRALDLFRLRHDEEWEARTLNQTAWYSALSGLHEQARSYCDAALVLHRHHQNRNGEALSLGIQGYLAVHTGQPIQALDFCEQALTLLRGIGNTYYEADVLNILGQVHTALGNDEQARRSWQQALELFRTQHRTDNAQQVEQQLDALAGHKS